MIRNPGTVVVSVIGTASLFLLLQNSGPPPSTQESLQALSPLSEKYLAYRKKVLRHNDQSDGSFGEKLPTPQTMKNHPVAEGEVGNTTWDGGTQAGGQDEESLLQQSQKEKELWEKEVESREAVFAERRNNIAEVCKNSTENLIPSRDIYNYRKLIYFNDYKFMWCPILKAGSTLWMSSLKSLLNVKKLHRDKLRKMLGDLDSKGKKALLKKYFSFMIVRHPLDRLLSAYRDKMLKVKSKNFSIIQREIITAYRSRNSTINSEHPTFTEFLQRVRDDMRENRKIQADGKNITMNQHWEPYWSSCSPCQINYNATLKIETMSVDQEYVIRTLGLQGKIKNSKKHVTRSDKYESTQEATVGYFSEVPLSLLEEVVKEYQGDFDLFGYSPKEYFILAKPDR